VNTLTSGGWGELINDFNIQDSNLVGLWHMNDNATDSSGQNNVGTWFGNEAYSNALWDTNAADFDWDSNIILTNEYDFSDASHWTVGFWMKTNGTGKYLVVGKASDYYNYMGFYLTGNTFEFRNNSAQYGTTPANLKANT
jgi:hypothetical protein